MSTSTRRVVIAVALLIALVVGYKLYDRKKSAGNEESSNGEAQSQDNMTSEERVAAARARKAQRLVAKPSQLGGVVLDAETREPVSGANVSLGRTSLDLGASLKPGEAKAPIMTVTGQDGRFAIPDLRSGELSVTATAPGYLPTSRDRIQLKGGEERSGIELLLVRGGNELSGTVTDVGGGPIPFAYVRAQRINEATVMTLFRAPVTAITDASGRYSMSLQDGNYLLQAGHADYVRTQRDTEIVGGPRSEDFALVPGAIIEGRVLYRGTEEPVANATVTPTPRGGRISGAVFTQGAKTNAEGKFVLSGLKSGEVSLIAVARNSASRMPKTLVLGIAEHRTDVVIYVDAAYTISGFVVNSDKMTEGIPRVMVAAYNIGTRSAAVTSDPSLADGYFEIVGVVPGGYTIGAISEGMEPEIANQSVEVVDKDVDGIVIPMSAGLSIKGRVDPRVAAYVRLEIDFDSFSLSGIPRMIASQLSRTTADENGNFELRGLTSGKMTVVAEHIEHGAGRVPVDLKSPGLTDVVVKLEPAASIAGTVTDSNGQPIVRARVRAGGGGSGAIGFGGTFSATNGAITGNDGDFIIRGLKPATYRLSVRREGQRLAWTGESLVKAGGSGTKAIEVVLKDGQELENMNLQVEASNEKIKGQVLDAAGKPAADAWVKLGEIGANNFRGGPPGRRANAEANEDDIETDDALFTRLSPELTDAEGYFVFEGLKKGEYWVSATSASGDAVGTVKPVATNANVVIKLESMGSATGTVTLGGAPVTNYTLKIDGPRLVRLPVASDTGAYAVERMPAGRYEFQIQSESGRARKAVEITGTPIVVNFEIESYSEVTGTVVGVKSGKPLANMAVLAVSEGSDTDAIGAQIVTGEFPTTDADGKFVVSRQGIGKATIVVINAVAGVTPVGQTTVELEQGKTVDAGIVYAVDTPIVAEAMRGDFGFETTAATFSKRPVPDDDQVAPSGDASEEFLWVSEVTAGSAAELAGLKLGDRISKVDEIDLATVGANIGNLILRSNRNGVGQTRALTIARADAAVVIDVVAAPITP